MQHLLGHDKIKTDDLKFVEWSPLGFKISMCQESPVVLPSSRLACSDINVMLMTNTSAVGQLFQRTVRKFNHMYTKRAFVHWFVTEGMEECEFAEAKSNVQALVDDYEACCGKVEDTDDNVTSAANQNNQSTAVSWSYNGNTNLGYGYSAAMYSFVAIHLFLLTLVLHPRILTQCLFLILSLLFCNFPPLYNPSYQRYFICKTLLTTCKPWHTRNPVPRPGHLARRDRGEVLVTRSGPSRRTPCAIIVSHAASIFNICSMVTRQVTCITTLILYHASCIIAGTSMSRREAVRLTYKKTSNTVSTNHITKQTQETTQALSAQNDTLQILIKANNRTIHCNISEKATVTSLKEYISNLTAIPLQSQYMSFEGRNLEDCNRLTDYNIKQFSTITLYVRVRGGMDTCCSNAGDIEDISEPISAINIKFNPFIRKNPSVWFRQVEAKLALARVINDKAKYNTLLAELPEDIISELPEDITTYNQLKQFVLEQNQKSKQQLIEDALSECSLEGEKPSVFVRKIKKKLQDIELHPSEDVLRVKLIKAMPESTRMSLTGHQHMSLEDFAQVADSLYELALRQPTICQINSTKQVHNPTNINQGQFSNNHAQQRYAGTHTPIADLGLVPFSVGQRQKICRYHIFFGERARACKPWCKWPGTKPINILPSSRASSRAASPVPPSESSNL